VDPTAGKSREATVDAGPARRPRGGQRLISLMWRRVRQVTSPYSLRFWSVLAEEEEDEERELMMGTHNKFYSDRILTFGPFF
ncbi:unnamed protein product, partial [Musa acuminata subsp. burmannicoides]